MNLHRTLGTPEWETVEAASYNRFQKVAAATRGVVSPANIITVIGLIVVIFGLVAILNHQFLLGLGLLIAGRLLDVADGLVAELTKTKSPLGEIFDAAADKIGTLFTITVLFVAGISYWWVIVALRVPQAIIPLVIFYKKRKGIGVHPTVAGKLSMAFTWVGIAGLIVAEAFEDVDAFTIAVYCVIGVSLVLGMYTLWQYATGRDQ